MENNNFESFISNLQGSLELPLFSTQSKIPSQVLCVAALTNDQITSLIKEKGWLKK